MIVGKMGVIEFVLGLLMDQKNILRLLLRSLFRQVFLVLHVNLISHMCHPNQSITKILVVKI